MTALVPIIREVTRSGGEFNLFTRGTSMRPTICEGRHSVLLCECTTPVPGDIVLYERSEGHFVLHRIVRIRGSVMTMCGDNQFVLENGVPVSSIVAKVDKILDGENALFVNKSLLFRWKLGFIRLIRRAKCIAAKIIKKK